MAAVCRLARAAAESRTRLPGVGTLLLALVAEVDEADAARDVLLLPCCWWLSLRERRLADRGPGVEAASCCPFASAALLLLDEEDDDDDEDDDAVGAGAVLAKCSAADGLVSTSNGRKMAPKAAVAPGAATGNRLSAEKSALAAPSESIKRSTSQDSAVAAAAPGSSTALEGGGAGGTLARFSSIPAHSFTATKPLSTD